MDHTLAANGVLLFPLCPETFRFLGLANRAIPLIPVSSIKKMSVLAVRLSGILRRYRVAFPQSVFSCCGKPEMAYRDAGPVHAGMVYHQLRRDAPVVMPVNDSMSAPIFLPEKENPISILIDAAFENKAFALSDHSTEKSFLFRFCHRHGATLY